MRGYWDYRLMVRSPEGDGAGGGGAGNGSEGGQGNQGAGGGEQKPAWASEFGDNFDPERAWATITNLRNAEKALTRRASTAEGKVKEFEQADQTEAQKLKSTVDELKAQLTQYQEREKAANLRSQIAEEARKQNALGPDDVFALLDQAQIEVDENGKVKNAVALVNGIRTAKPYLFGQQTVGAGAGRNGRGGSDQEKAGGGSSAFNDSIRRSFGIG